MNEFLESLPESLRDAPFLAKAENAEAAINALTNAAQTVGNSIRIPGENASAEDIASFQAKAVEKFPGLMPSIDITDEAAVTSAFARLGRPDADKEYNYPEIADFEWTAEAKAAISIMAKDAGLTQTQFNAYAKKQIGDQIEATHASTEAVNQDQKSLKDEWGVAYDENMSKAKAAANKTEAPTELKEALEAGTLPSGTIKWLHGLASALGEEGTDNSDNGNGADNTGMVTPSEAEAQIQEIMDNPDYSPDRPMYARLQKRRMELEFMAAGQKPPN